MPSFRIPTVILAATFATTLAFAQSSSTTPDTKANPYPTDPANGSTKPTPAAQSNKIVVPAPPNAAADAKAEAETQASPLRPARISGGVMAGLIQTKVAPMYPAEAKAKGISGTVVLHAIIGKDGHIENINAVSGNTLLQEAALDAVKQWTYKPYMLNGRPTEVETTIMVNFNLSNTPPTRNP